MIQTSGNSEEILCGCLVFNDYHRVTTETTRLQHLTYSTKSLAVAHRQWTRFITPTYLRLHDRLLSEPFAWTADTSVTFLKAMITFWIVQTASKSSNEYDTSRNGNSTIKNVHSCKWSLVDWMNLVTLSAPKLWKQGSDVISKPWFRFHIFLNLLMCPLSDVTSYIYFL